METRKEIASLLLQSNAIKLEPAKPFTWASGWKSPIYCDNRKTLSYPAVRNYIRDSFIKKINDLYPQAELIAGVATGAIAHGVLVADKMKLPFVYVRSEAKSHGLTNIIEGVTEPHQKVVVIEDLVSTGGSSIKAVNALRDAGCSVLGLIAIFSYGFPQADRNFNEAECRIDTLSDYNSLIELAAENGFINDSQAAILGKWRLDPENWMK